MNVIIFQPIEPPYKTILVQGSSTAVNAFMENLFAKNFPDLLTIATNGDYMLLLADCYKLVYCSWAIRVNHAAEHFYRVAILNLFQESYLLWRANNLFRQSRNEL